MRSRAYPVNTDPSQFLRRHTTFLRLLFAANPTWLDIALIFCASILAVAAGTPFPLIAIVFGQLVDDMNAATCAANSEDQNGFDFESQIHEKIALMVYISVAAFVLIYLYITMWGVISQRLAQRMRVTYLESLLRQPPSFFDARDGARDVSGRLHGDIAAIQAGTSEKVGILITTVSFFVTAFTISFIKEARLAGMLTSMVPAFLLMSVLGGRFFRKYTARMSEALSTASSLASEALSNISVVQAFGAAGRLEDRFAASTLEASRNGIRKAAVSATQAGLLYFLAYAGNALAFWKGSYYIADNAEGKGKGTSVGTVYTVIMILVDACVMLGNTAPILPIVGGASAAYRRLLDDLEQPSAIDGTSDKGRTIPANASSLDISFNNVSFTYPSRKDPVLRGVNMTFPTGRYTAIVGLSGSGKSTVAALLSRLYDPNEGTVSLGGHDIRDINVRSLRSLMGFVQQEPSLMNGSVFANIALGLIGSPDPAHAPLQAFLYSPQMDELSGKGRDIATAARDFGPAAEEVFRLVQWAAEQADAASFIERLENGYGTSAGPKGTLLSGGQRQRVALAQAMIRNPRILVLDEATSALDTASERRIQGAVERAAASKERTVICIAHRLSTIRAADNIVVMEAGRVVEEGTYSDLVSRDGGAFARMVSLQSVGTTDRSEGSSVSGDSLSTPTLKDTEVSEGEVPAEKTSEDDKKPEADKPKEEPVEKEDIGLDAKRPVGYVTKSIWRLIRPSLPWLLAAVCAAILVGLTFPSSGTVIGFTVGRLNPCSSSPDSVRSAGLLFSGLLFMVAVVELFANFTAWSCFGIVAEKMLHVVRVLSFRSLMEQDIQWHQAESPAKLLAVITKDSAAIGGFSGSTIGTVFAILVNFIAAIALSHAMAWKVALVCLAAAPILLFNGFMQLRMLARYEEATKDAFASATAVAVEAVQSIRTVAVLSLESEIMTTFSRLLSGPQKQIFKASAATNIWLAMTHSVGKLIYCLAYWWGSRFIMSGEYSQTQFFIVLISMLVSAQLWATMFNLAPEFSRARTAMSRTMNVISLGSTKDLASPGRRRDVEAGVSEKGPLVSPGPTRDNRGVSISFDKVSFAYPNRPDVPILDEVSLNIRPGQFAGLVGPSGAGKSTIMSLVQRFHTPTSGTISLDGHDIGSLPPAAFRDSIALVPQDPTLFSGTVRFNVSLGAAPGHEATDEEIEEACRLANIHDVIAALPEGYNTECGPSASRLSGGQRQRLAIARALVRRPRLLLLDESTSALDAASEAALQEGLERASRGTTVLAITHRLHTVQKADVIFVVEGGRIVDAGTHADLMQRRESYRVNAMQQMLQ